MKQEKFCKGCETIKSHEHFYKIYTEKYIKLSTLCILCKTKYDKKYREDNKEKIKIYKKEYKQEHKEENDKYMKEWRANNKEKTRASNKKYRENNKEIVNAFKNKKDKERRETDPIYKIMKNTSSIFKKDIENNNIIKGGQKTFKLLGYTKEQLKEYIEIHFKIPGNEWMNWSNWGIYNSKTWKDNDPSTHKWNIDHIHPRHLLKYDSFEHENFKKAWALENLRPLSAKQNVLDSNNRTIEQIEIIKSEIKEKLKLKI